MAAHQLQAAPVYVKGRKVDPRQVFPETPFFQGFLKPTRFEGDIEELEVEGEIPEAINGTYFSIQTDHHYAPKYEGDVLFNGDGAVSAFRIFKGHVDWKRRYVQTDRLKAESAARRSLFGRYRNPYTDDESVQGVIRTAANTNVVFWRGVMLALKEDGPPFALDPVTLETIGRYDFEGQVLSPTFTAHPKLDTDTGELLCFGYEAGGNGNDASRDIVVYTIGPDGKKTEEAWYEAPYAGYIHDCGFTENYIIFPLTPLKADPEKLKAGGNHWTWDPNDYGYFGIAPRRGGKKEDMVWVRTKNCFQGHVAGTYEKDGKLIFDLTMADGNVFFWFPEDGVDIDGPLPPSQFNSPMCRYIFDLNNLVSDKLVKPTVSVLNQAEFSRIDDRYNGKYYTKYWILDTDITKPYDFAKCGPPPGGLWNLLVHGDWETGKQDSWWSGPNTTLQEPCFVPASPEAAEGDGYILVIVNHVDELRQDLAILQATNVSAGPIALVHLPLRSRMGFHGNFIDYSDIKEFKDRRGTGGDLGPATAALSPLPWQLKLTGN